MFIRYSRYCDMLLAFVDKVTVKIGKFSFLYDHYFLVHLWSHYMIRSVETWIVKSRIGNDIVDVIGIHSERNDLRNIPSFFPAV
jgi:hypothetical protein